MVKEESKEVFYYISKLTIKNAEKEDQGEYKAFAKNEHGEATAVVNLQYEGGSLK